MHLLESHNYDGMSALDALFTADEIQDCLCRLKTSKAGNPQEQGIVNELLKHGGPSMTDMLLAYCNMLWKLETVHHVPGTIINMPKKGDLSYCSNYRGITLLSVLYKLYTSVINRRLIKFAEGRLGTPQQRQQSQPAAAAAAAVPARQQQQSQPAQQSAVPLPVGPQFLGVTLLQQHRQQHRDQQQQQQSPEQRTRQTAGQAMSQQQPVQQPSSSRYTSSLAVCLLLLVLLLLLLVLQHWLLSAMAAMGMLGCWRCRNWTCWSWRRAFTFGQVHTGTNPSTTVLPVQPVQPRVQSLDLVGADEGAEGFRRFARGAAAVSPDAAVAPPGRIAAHDASPQGTRVAPANVMLHESQNGFRPERSCADHQFTLHQTLSGRRAEGKDSYVLFVDVTKAFPTVWLDGLWQKLWDKGVRGKCLRVLHSLYQGAKRVVSHDDVVSDMFTCDLGLHEGDPISPTLYLFFIDDLLQEIWRKFPGVQIVDCSTGAVSDVVAAMQADDLVVVCESLEETHAVAATILEYSKKWRFKLNGSKSAVMHVAAQGSSSLSESGIVWDEVAVPVVSKYCYLGVWFQNTLAWDVQFESVMRKAESAKYCYMPIWKSRHIKVEVKRIVLLSCVRPLIEYGCEVWIPTPIQQRKLDKIQTDIIKLCMHLKSDNPSSDALLAEWGLKPMHKWLHERILMFHAKLSLMPRSRLPKQLFNAMWSKNGRVVVLPWQKYVAGLLLKYGIDIAPECEYSSCKSVIKRCVKSVWQEDLTLRLPLNKVSLHRYIDWVNPKLLTSLSLKSPAQYLCVMPPSYGIEVLLRVRLSTLPVHAHTAHYSRRDGDGENEPQSSVVVARGCPMCQHSEESLAHLLFDCPRTHAVRTVMYDTIRQVEGCDAKLNACLAIADPRRRVCRFVSDDLWGSVSELQFVVPSIAQYLAEAWSMRNQCKHNSGRTAGVVVVDAAPETGRGADGRNAMADG